MSSQSNECRRYCIYAILHKKLVFVGKSTAKEPRGRLYAHRHGDNEWTRSDFLFESDLRFIPLEYLHCFRHEVLHHLVAWMYYFEEHGYVLLNDPKFAAMTESLKPETQVIYETICAPVTESELLARRPEPPPPSLPEKEKITDQLNIRVTKSTADGFRAFSKHCHLSQSDTLAQLLTSVSGHNPLAEQNQLLLARIDELEKERGELSRKCRDIGKAERSLRRVLLAFSQAVFLQAMENAAPRPAGAHLKPQQFRAGKEAFADYTYPPRDGCAVVSLAGLLWGKRRGALFVLADREGERVKFRFYPGKGYVGLHPADEEYAQPDSEWIVAYSVDNGVADLRAAIPLAVFRERRISLDERIRRAQSYTR